MSVESRVGTKQDGSFLRPMRALGASNSPAYQQIKEALLFLAIICTAAKEKCCSFLMACYHDGFALHMMKRMVLVRSVFIIESDDLCPVYPGLDNSYNQPTNQRRRCATALESGLSYIYLACVKMVWSPVYMKSKSRMLFVQTPFPSILSCRPSRRAHVIISRYPRTYQT